MKKLFIAAIIFCLLFALPFAATAADNTYTMDVNGASMTITMPEGWDVFTRDMASNQPILSKYGISPDDFQQLMEEQSIYLDAMNPAETQYEIIVVLLKDEYSAQASNLSAMSDADLEALMNEYGDQVIGYELSSVDWIKVGDYKYLYYKYGSPVHSIQYTTIVNGEWVSITLSNFQNGELGSDNIDQLTNTVQSISFKNIDDTSPVSAESLMQYPVNTTVLLLSLAFGAVIAVLLLRLLFQNKNKILYVSQQQYANLNRIGGTLAFMAFRIILGIIIGLGSLSQMVPGTYLNCYIFIIILCVFNIILLFAKARLFIAMYVLTDIYMVVLYASYLNYAGAVITGIIEALFFLYLFRSARVAIVYKTKEICLAEAAVASDPPQTIPAGTDINAARNAAASLEDLKAINPVAYKRNVVAIAAGFRDFAGMISSNPYLDNSLAFATKDEDLDKISAAYGFDTFEDMFQYSLQTIQMKKDKQE